jgi:hypothetical protein
MEELFSGRHFDRGLIILCVRWYLRYKLSFRDLVEMMAERGVLIAHTTILRWVRHYGPKGCGAKSAKAAARFEEKRRLCGEDCIPDRWDSLTFETKTPKRELSFANAAEQLDPSDGGCCTIKVFEAKHRSSSEFDTAVILLDQVVQIL